MMTSYVNVKDSSCTDNMGDDDNNVCGGKSGYSPLQVEVVDSGLNECKSEQDCKSVCHYVYKSMHNLTTKASMALCEVEIY